MGIRKIIYGILQLGAESTATTQATAVIQSTSGSLALVPSGSGAITAAIPDGTTVGGNARGTNAIDLQIDRTNSDQVATGTGCVVIGARNKAIGNNSVAIGILNSTSGNNQISIGNNNVTSGGNINFSIGSFLSTSGIGSVNLGASNTNSSNYSTVSGGQSNTASTNTHATVVGGLSNTASGQYSVAGGQSNTASGGNSVAFGQLAVSSGAGSVSLGTGNQSTGANSICVGYGGVSHLIRSFTIGNSGGIAPYAGAVQQTYLTPYKEATLTTAATTVLSLDGTGTTNLIIPNGTNRMWKVKVEWIAAVTTITGTATGITVGDMAYGEANFGFKKVSGTSVLGNFINDEEASDSAIMDTCTLSYSVGASQELALTFTGPTFAGGGSVTMRVVAKVSLVEVAY